MGQRKSNLKSEIHRIKGLLPYQKKEKKNKKKPQMNNLTLQLNELESQEQTKHKVSRRKDIKRSE